MKISVLGEHFRTIGLVANSQRKEKEQKEVDDAMI